MKNDDEGYCYQLVISALNPNEDMSVALRAWCLFVGIPGMIVADPVMFICNKLGVSGRDPDEDITNPTHPMNQNY